MKGEISDSRLIEGIRHRDDTCFKYLYSKSYLLVSGYVMRSGGSSEDVKDLLQDCLVIVYENVAEGVFQGRSGLMTYFFSICKNRWMNYTNRRKNKNVPIDGYANLMNLIYEDDQEEELAERAKYAESLISASTDRCKEILLAFYYESLSMEEIAGQLGYTNADSAKNQKAKCMDKLRVAVKSLAINEL